MAIPAYMWITDDQGLAIDGLTQINGRENSIEVLGFQHQVYIPNDRDTGVLTGTRKHEPFVISKNFCCASPVLYKACCSGQNLKKLQLSWYRINEAGQEQEYFRHVLTNAKVVSVQPRVADVKDRNMEGRGHVEDISFRYEKILWSYLDGNINTEDEWSRRD